MMNFVVEMVSFVLNNDEFDEEPADGRGLPLVGGDGAS